MDLIIHPNVQLEFTLLHEMIYYVFSGDNIVYRCVLCVFFIISRFYCSLSILFNFILFVLQQNYVSAMCALALHVLMPCIQWHKTHGFFDAILKKNTQIYIWCSLQTHSPDSLRIKMWCTFTNTVIRLKIDIAYSCTKFLWIIFTHDWVMANYGISTEETWITTKKYECDLWKIYWKFQSITWVILNEIVFSSIPINEWDQIIHSDKWTFEKMFIFEILLKPYTHQEINRRMATAPTNRTSNFIVEKDERETKKKTTMTEAQNRSNKNTPCNSNYSNSHTFYLSKNRYGLK